MSPLFQVHQLQKRLLRKQQLLWQLLDQCPIAALTSKSQGQISSREHELYNSQENSTGNYNSILLTIYITIHSLCYDYASAVCPTLMSMSCPHVYYWSTLDSITHLPYVYLKASMPYICTLTSYPKPYSSSPLSMHAPCAHHGETMVLTCSLISLYL